ncbi:D-alanyl-D-alanine carboxypeptidase family protein [Thioflexithrix psekupsensis]|uniref:serine-type D-Ala-D-Ala carboxypeptidase n=1 Tax=Thioflexithrix psekupsensis TaxID=1570016 RepID=A0A251X5B1_9GAMM|nr:D-alanyl-D-alanine carboxypeptidase family protein [Thioflexithrix psekupsensis]OUD12576.1 serine-type D-Ala-D-Ala carboxypeptidase [Thioflexithrix psekupsensis]
MIKQICNLLFLAVIIYGNTAAYANTVTLVPTPPPIDGTAYLLMDFNSEQLLMEKNGDQRVDPASLTKLMTAYLVFDKLKKGELKLTDTVRISETARRMIGSRMYVEVDTEVAVEALIQGMIVQSGNDASVALAEHIAGSEANFAALMNDMAEKLGLTQTRYQNSTGLPHPEHYSTARDQAVMAQSLIKNFPDYYRWYSQKEYTYNNITQQNRNTLLWRDESVDGMKTGYTDAAGYCLIASAKRGQMRLISVVLGTKSKAARISETQKMIDYGFRFFETYQIYRGNEPLQTAKVWSGNHNEIQLGLLEPLYVTIPRGQYSQLNAALQLPAQLTAPIAQHTVQGQLKILLGNETLREVPIVALHAVEVGSWMQRALDYVRMKFR